MAKRHTKMIGRMKRGETATLSPPFSFGSLSGHEQEQNQLKQKQDGDHGHGQGIQRNRPQVVVDDGGRHEHDHFASPVDTRFPGFEQRIVHSGPGRERLLGSPGSTDGRPESLQRRLPPATCRRW